MDVREERSSRIRRVSVKTWDVVSANDALVGRFRLDDGSFSAWRPASELADIDAGTAGTIDVEVLDEEGNVGRIRQALVRGRPDPTLAASATILGQRSGERSTRRNRLRRLLCR